MKVTKGTLLNVFFAFLSVGGQVGQNVVLPLWLSAYPSKNSTGNATAHHEVAVDGYFVVTFASFCFVVIFGLWTLIYAIISAFQEDGKKILSSTDRTFPQLELFWIGFFDALNGIMVVFAAAGDRTSPLLQTLLGNFMIPLTIVLRLAILKKKPTLLQLVTAIVVFLAIFFCFVPTIFNLDPPPTEACPSNSSNSNNTTKPESTAGRVLWPLCFMFGFVPAALMNVLEERSLQRRHGVRRGQINIIYFLFCTSCYQLLTSAALFWTDIIPGFGRADGLKNFGENYHLGFSCFFGGDGCGSTTGGRGTLFIVFYVISYLGGGLLLRYSGGATYLAVVNSMTTPLGFFFWTLFLQPPCRFKFHPNANHSTWFSLGGIVVMVPCILLYNLQKSRKSPDEKHLLGEESGESVGDYRGFSVNPNYTSGSY